MKHPWNIHCVNDWYHPDRKVNVIIQKGGFLFSGVFDKIPTATEIDKAIKKGKFKLFK